MRLTRLTGSARAPEMSTPLAPRARSQMASAATATDKGRAQNVTFTAGLPACCSATRLPSPAPRSRLEIRPENCSQQICTHPELLGKTADGLGDGALPVAGGPDEAEDQPQLGVGVLRQPRHTAFDPPYMLDYQTPCYYRRCCLTVKHHRRGD